MAELPTRRVFDLAYGRAGDKGDIANISVIARSSAAYQTLKATLTAARAQEALRDLAHGPVERFELDNIEALNFVIRGALDGGATRSLRIDTLGKALAGAILRLPIEEQAPVHSAD
ncbi:MAG TPA: hypothetical protein VF808_04805 [Ktedonobacterales bacterium]